LEEFWPDHETRGLRKVGLWLVEARNHLEWCDGKEVTRRWVAMRAYKIVSFEKNRRYHNSPH
jgi:hypothetical protein